MAYSTNTLQAVTAQPLESPQSLNDIRTVEISFEEHEIYIGVRAIAKIVCENDDFATQPWVVTVNGIEIHRANTWAKCYHYVTWHFKQGTLPEQKQEVAVADCKPIIVPVFISNPKFRQVLLLLSNALHIYFKLKRSLRIAALVFLFQRWSKSRRSDYSKT